MRRSARVSVHAGALVTVTAVAAVLSGQPFVFPSLGPSAYALAAARHREAVEPLTVVGAHAVGVLAGLAAHWTLAPGLTVTGDLPALSLPVARLGASAAVSVGATTAGMLLTDRVHPPACATTLIVSLGILPTLRDGAVILVAVGVLVAADAAVRAVVR